MQDERKSILIKNKGIDFDSNEPIKNEKQLMLFLSFDITDSSKQKINHPEKWPRIIDVLVKTKFQYMNYWKFNGDEILYKRSINNLDFICRIIDRANLHLKRLKAEMEKIIDDISVKATLWLALSENDAAHYKRNFSFGFEDEIDYVGKNIDEGFRLTKCSSMNKVAIDPKIVFIILDACMFYKQRNNRNLAINFYKSIESCEDSFYEYLSELAAKIHLVGYVKCKGVWNDSPYPIYWFYDNTEPTGIRYNEYLNGEHLWQKSISSFDVMHIDSDYANLYSIFKQMNVLPEINELYELLSFQGNLEMSAAGKANLYYMVVCTNPVTNKVMIARRSSQRKHLKNVWDFGNVKYQNINMNDTIVKEYKNTFGIDIELEIDNNRGGNLKPFGYCTIYRNGRPHNSILCHATIKHPNMLDDENLAEYILRHKSDAYDDIRFVSAEDVAGFHSLTLEEIRYDSERAEYGINEPFEDDTCIMYFADSIKGANH